MKFGAVVFAAALALAPAAAHVTSPVTSTALARPVTFHPAITGEVQFVKAGAAAPVAADCYSLKVRCFNPASMRNAYNVTPLYNQGDDGTGQTIVIVDAFGSAYIRNDLRVFDDAFGLPHMCGEAGTTCTAGMPTFNILAQASNPTTPPPPNNGTGQEAHNLWDVEIALDVEWSHAIAPGANILLVTTPTAETLGVQGFPDFMKAEQYVIDHHLGSVISQSFASGEGAFGSTQSLLNLRYAFEDARAKGVTVLGSSGDSGSEEGLKTPVKNPAVLPFAGVQWPASDPLVTGVGGTYLCLDAETGTTVDNINPGGRCTRAANIGQREVGWIAGGGGFSSVFARPSFQNSLPSGSTTIGSTRGVPDVAYEASATTGPLIYLSDPTAGTEFGGSPGWFVIGGTSAGSPQWAALIAIADQINGGPLGYINPALYTIGANPTRYAKDFYDVIKGTNQINPSIPGFNASTGWDPVTGLGTPNAANLLPDLVQAVHGK